MFSKKLFFKLCEKYEAEIVDGAKNLSINNVTIDSFSKSLMRVILDENSKEHFLWKRVTSHFNRFLEVEGINKRHYQLRLDDVQEVDDGVKYCVTVLNTHEKLEQQIDIVCLTTSYVCYGLQEAEIFVKECEERCK